MGMQNTATKRQQNLLTKRRRLDQDTCIHSFFERDENSRMTPGIKQTITVRKMKKQTFIDCKSTGIVQQVHH